MLPVVQPVAFDQGKVMLASLARPEHLMQCEQDVALLGDQQQARRIAIKAMGKLQEPGMRPRRPQALNHAERHTAAAVYGDPFGLVDHKQSVVFIDDGKLPGQLVAVRAGSHGASLRCMACRPRQMFNPPPGAALEKSKKTSHPCTRREYGFRLMSSAPSRQPHM